jgi:hypothetical protein
MGEHTEKSTINIASWESYKFKLCGPALMILMVKTECIKICISYFCKLPAEFSNHYHQAHEHLEILFWFVSN